MSKNIFYESSDSEDSHDYEYAVKYSKAQTLDEKIKCGAVLDDIEKLAIEIAPIIIKFIIGAGYKINKDSGSKC